MMNDQVLFLVFRNSFAIPFQFAPYSSTDEINDRWKIGEDVFDNVMYTFCAFYDWLRTSDSRVIGVRFWIDSYVDELVGTLIPYPNVKITHDGSALEVFFLVGVVDERLSNDQAFIPNPVLFGPRSWMAIVVNVADLTSKQIEQLYSSVHSDEKIEPVG